MVYLSPEDFHRCNESLELDAVCSSLADICHDISWHTEGDSFCVLSCMLCIKMRKNTVFVSAITKNMHGHGSRGAAPKEGRLLDAIFPIPR